MKKEYNILIIYDISENKTRNNFFNILSGYGHSIQKSAFLCILNNYQYKKMLLSLYKIKIDNNDSVCIYKLYKFKKIIMGKKLNIMEKNYLIL